MITDNQKWLDSLTEGMEVAIEEHQGYRLATVVRRLKASLEVQPTSQNATKLKFHSRTGRLASASKWDFCRIVPVTPEILHKMKLKQAQYRLKAVLSKLEIHHFSLEQCESFLHFFKNRQLPGLNVGNK